MDAYFNKGRFLDVLKLRYEMHNRRNCKPTLQVFTKLMYSSLHFGLVIFRAVRIIQGFCLVRNHTVTTVKYGSILVCSRGTFAYK